MNACCETPAFVAPNTPTNEGGLRYPDEFVRHKTLDLIGDLTLIGRPLFKMRVGAECLGLPAVAGGGPIWVRKVFEVPAPEGA